MSDKQSAFSVVPFIAKLVDRPCKQLSRFSSKSANPVLRYTCILKRNDFCLKTQNWLSSLQIVNNLNAKLNILIRTINQIADREEVYDYKIVTFRWLTLAAQIETRNLMYYN